MTNQWRVLVGAVIAAVAAGWFLTRAVHEPSPDDLEVERDLTELAAALREDQTTVFEVPRTESISMMNFPTSLQYRRANDFWRPVFGKGGKEQR